MRARGKKRFPCWYKKEVADVRAESDSLENPNRKWHGAIKQYLMDIVKHTKCLSNEAVGVKLLEREGLLSRDISDYIIQNYIHRPLTWREARMRDVFEYWDILVRGVITAVVLAVLFLPIIEKLTTIQKYAIVLLMTFILLLFPVEFLERAYQFRNRI